MVCVCAHVRFVCSDRHNSEGTYVARCYANKSSYNFIIIESVDSISRDGQDMPYM